MFCPKCGSEDVVDVFCASCLRELHPLVKGFKPYDAEVCVVCGKINHKGHWHETKDAPGQLAEFLKAHIVFADDSEIENVAVGPLPVEMKPGLKQSADTRATVTGRASKKAKSYQEEYDFSYTILNTYCPRCRKLGTEYFEGTLQVRNEDKESKKFLAEFLRRSGASVAKSVPERNGTDYMLTSKSAVERAGLALQAEFGGTLKASAQLFSHNRQTSKDIYRVNAFVELPKFKEGDVVRGLDELLFVAERGKKIKFYNPRRDKFEFHELKESTWEVIPTFETTVAGTRPALSVIHPETFQAVRVWNAAHGAHEPGEKVVVCLDGEKVFLVERGS
jgi:nonsense-mediated mRNA decay protein 3